MPKRFSLLLALVFGIGCLAGWLATRFGHAPGERDVSAAPASPSRPPRIRSVAADRSSMPRYERLELTIDLDATDTNPFDPDEIAVEARFRAPSGQEQVVPAFWYRPYRRQLLRNTERLSPTGAGGFRVRFAPTEVGGYRYRVTARTPAGTDQSPEKTFTATAGSRHGYVRVSRQNPFVFAFDDGSPYFAIGANVCWSGPRGTYDYDDWFVRYAAAGANYARLWLGPFDLFTLERRGSGNSEFGAGRYDLESAWRLDHVLELAERRGLYLMFCLESFNSLRIRPPHEMWQNNPYNRANGGFLEVPEQFFTDERARRFFRQRLRYLVARWGYSPHLLAWEFWNEVDIIEKYVPTEVRDWHVAMSRHLRDLDPWDHLQTTSFSGSEGDPGIDRLPEMSFTQTHRYGPLDMAADLPEWGRRKTQAFRKPHFVGEFGTDVGGPRGEADPTGIHLHNGIWSTALSRSAGAAMLWWWDTYIDPRNLYPHFAALSAFTRGVDWAGDGLSPLLSQGTGAQHLAFQSPSTSPTLRDLWISPRHGSWEPAPFNEPRTFKVAQTGEIGDEEHLARISHGKRNHPRLHNPATFEVDYTRAGKFIARVAGVSGYGGAGLEIWLDGKQILSRDFADPDGNEKTETMQQFAGDYAIDVPAGRHTVRVVNPGTDWLEISYRLTGYQTVTTPPLRVIGMRGPTLSLLWVQNLDHTWFKRSLGGTLPTVAASVLTLAGYTDGAYSVEVWDTYRGRVTQKLRAHAKVSSLRIPLPPIEKDIALKVRRT